MAHNEEQTHVMSVLVENEFGVLARIAGMFAARSFNIESLTVGPTHDHSMSRITAVVRGNTAVIDQVRKQLEKLIEIIAIQDLTETETGHIARELVFVKVHCNPGNRVELMQIGDLFKAEAVDYTPGSLTFQLVGPSAKIDNFLTFLGPYEIAEVARSGVVGMNRGAGGLQTTLAAEMEKRSEVRAG